MRRCDRLAPGHNRVGSSSENPGDSHGLLCGVPIRSHGSRGNDAIRPRPQSRDREADQRAIEQGFSSLKVAWGRSYEATTLAKDLAQTEGMPNDAKIEESELSDLRKMQADVAAMEQAWKAHIANPESPSPLEDIKTTFDQTIIRDIARYDAQSVREMEQSSERAQELLQTSNLYLVFTTLGAVLVAALAGVFLARTILNPLRTLTRAAREVARGNLDARVQMERTDELGLLAQTFNSMLDSLRENVVTRDQLEGIITQRTAILISFLNSLSTCFASQISPGGFAE